MHLSIITPEQTLYSGKADMVTVPGAEGDMGVLPGHAPTISTLRPGLIVVEAAGKPAERIAVLDGVADITPAGVTVLSDTARAIFGMSAQGAQEELARAQAELDKAVTPTAAQTRALAMAQMLTEVL